jgi:hypothetical protein
MDQDQFSYLLQSLDRIATAVEAMEAASREVRQVNGGPSLLDVQRSLSRAEWYGTTLAAERDSARRVAVRLEQELAHVNHLLDALVLDLRQMDATEAIDLNLWPAAWAVVDWRAQS